MVFASDKAGVEGLVYCLVAWNVGLRVSGEHLKRPLMARSPSKLMRECKHSMSHHHSTRCQCISQYRDACELELHRNLDIRGQMTLQGIGLDE